MAAGGVGHGFVRASKRAFLEIRRPRAFAAQLGGGMTDSVGTLTDSVSEPEWGGGRYGTD